MSPERALALLIQQAIYDRKGIKASTSKYAEMLSRLENDLIRCRYHATRTSYWYHNRTYTWDIGYVGFDLYGGSGNEFTPLRYNLSLIHVAQCIVYRDAGLGSPGEVETVTVGNSLLQGPWWDLISDAAKSIAKLANQADRERSRASSRHAKNLKEAQMVVSKLSRKK